MSKSIGSIIGSVSLYLMIASVVVADSILYWQGQTIWGVFWSCIIGIVVLFELYGKFISKEKKTISQMWDKWKAKSPFWSYLTLGILALSLLFLWLHLGL